jgi:hypothetical protein
MVMVACDSNAALDRMREAVASAKGVATATTHLVLDTPFARE